MSSNRADNNWVAAVGAQNGQAQLYTSSWTDKRHYICQYNREYRGFGSLELHSPQCSFVIFKKMWENVMFLAENTIQQNTASKYSLITAVKSTHVAVKRSPTGCGKNYPRKVFWHYFSNDLTFSNKQNFTRLYCVHKYLCRITKFYLIITRLYVCPAVCNSLPQTVLSSDSVAVFKLRLKTFLFSQAFSSFSAH